MVSSVANQKEPELFLVCSNSLVCSDVVAGALLRQGFGRASRTIVPTSSGLIRTRLTLGRRSGINFMWQIVNDIRKESPVGV